MFVTKKLSVNKLMASLDIIQNKGLFDGDFLPQHLGIGLLLSSC